MNWINKNFKLLSLLLLLAILVVAVIILTMSADSKRNSVAYVNLEKVFAEHPARIAAQSKLDKQAAAYQTELEEQAVDLSGVEQKEMLQKYQKQLNGLEGDLLDSVTKEVEATIAKTALEEKVKFVVNEKDMLYGGYDMTADVIARIKQDWQSSSTSVTDQSVQSGDVKNKSGDKKSESASNNK